MLLFKALGFNKKASLYFGSQQKSDIPHNLLPVTIYRVEMLFFWTGGLDKSHHSILAKQRADKPHNLLLVTI